MPCWRKSFGDGFSWALNWYTWYWIIKDIGLCSVRPPRRSGPRVGMVTRLRHYWRTHKPSGGWGQVILAPAEFGKSHRQKLWSYSRGQEFVLGPVLEIKNGFPDNIIPWSDGTCAHSSAPSRARTMCEHGEAPCLNWFLSSALENFQWHGMLKTHQ